LLLPLLSILREIQRATNERETDRNRETETDRVKQTETEIETKR